MTAKKKKTSVKPADQMKIPASGSKYFNRNSFLVLIIIFIVTITASATLLLHNEIESLYRQLDNLNRDKVKAEQQILELKSRITALQRPDRIRQIAKDRLGMADTKPNIEVITIQ